MAAKGGDRSIVVHLVEKEADVNITDDTGVNIEFRSHKINFLFLVSACNHSIHTTCTLWIHNSAFTLMYMLRYTSSCILQCHACTGLSDNAFCCLYI